MGEFFEFIKDRIPILFVGLILILSLTKNGNKHRRY